MTTPNVPLWLQPSTPGMLSNRRGTNTGADAITLKIRYSNPNQADKPSGIRLRGQKTASAGGLVQPVTIWDSQWIGVPVSSPLPTTVPTGFTGNVVSPVGACGVVCYGGRIYALVADFGQTAFNRVGILLSAPLSGCNVGSWRYELAPPIASESQMSVIGAWPDYAQLGGLCVINGRLYVGTEGSIWRGDLQSDGSLSNWQIGGIPFSLANSTMTGWDNLNGTGVLACVNGNGAGGPGVLTFTVAADGTTTYVASSAVGVTNGLDYAGLHIDVTGFIYVIGGEDSAGAALGTPRTTVRWASINLTTGVIGAWSNGATLPAARSRHAMAAEYSYAAARFAPSAAIVSVMGGIATSGGAGQTAIYFINGSSLQTPGNLWTTCNYPLQTGASFAGATLIGPGPTVDADVLNETDQGFQLTDGATVRRYFAIVGGGTTAVQLATEDDSSAVRSGPATVLTAPLLGVGGSIVDNQDGTTDYTFSFKGAQAGSALTNLTPQDGDQVQLSVQFVDAAAGDPSPPVAITSIRVGQPPALSAITPSGTSTSGAPSIAFAYTAGAGGAAQDHWRTQLLDGATVVADSGVRLDTVNVFTPVLAPRLTSGQPYSHVITAASQDTPMTSGDSATATATTSFTPTFPTPATPSASSLSTDTTLMAFNLTTTALAGPAAPPVVTDGGRADPGFTAAIWRSPPTLAARSAYSSAPGATTLGVASTLGKRRRWPVQQRAASRIPNQPATLHSGAPGFALAYTYVTAAGESPASPAAAAVLLAATGNQLNVASISGIPAGVTALNFYYSGSVPTGDVAGFVAQQTVSANTCAAFSLRTEGNGVAAPGGPTLRVYHRRTGTTPWTLLRDAVASTPGTPQVIGPLLDQLAWATAYDFALAAVSSVGESAMTSALSGTLPTLDASGHAVMLHVAGNGRAAGLFHAGGLRVKTRQDAQAVEMGGLSAPKITYGLLKYRTIEAKVRILTTADMVALQAVRDAAMAGAVLYWRDAAGRMLTVGILEEVTLDHLAASYNAFRELAFKLVEIPNLSVPYAPQGSAARGLFAVANGTIVALDPSETLF